MSDLDKFNYECEGQMSLFEEKRNKMKDTLSVKDILDYCEKCANQCEELNKRALEHYGKTGNNTSISTMAYFMQRETMYRHEMPDIIKYLAEEHEEKTFGEKIIKLLEENNLSQKKLAVKVGITEVSMSRYISGDRVPKGPIIVKIAKELGTTVEYLMEETK